MTNVHVLSLNVFLVGLIASACGQDTTQQFVGFSQIEPMPMARSDMTATVYPSTSIEGTRVYLIGGCSSHQICYGPSQCYCGAVTNSTQYFLPAQNRYVTTCADAPRERYRHAAAQVNGVIYLFGGRMLNDTIITEVDAYDINTNTWSTPCTWSDAGSDNTAFVDNNRIFLTGGWTPDYSSAVGTLLEFNASQCTFTARAPMPTPRGDVSTVSVGGLHFVVGGFSTDFCAADAVVQAYNVTSNSWSTLASLDLGRGDAAVGAIGGQVFVIGGETVNDACTQSIPVSDVETLVPRAGGSYTGNWSMAQSVPSGRFRFVGASYQSTIYLFGGQGSYTDSLDGDNGGFPVLSDVMVYSPLTYTSAEVTTLLAQSQANNTALTARIGALETTIASQASTISSLQSQLNTLSTTVGRIDSACLAPPTSMRERRTTGCAGSSSSSSSSSGASSVAVYVGVSVAVVVVVGAVAGVAMWSRKSVLVPPHKPLDDAVVNPVFGSTYVEKSNV